MSTVTSGSGATEAITYEDLYARWERGQWRASEIDFTQDAVDWRERLDDQQRRSVLWLFALFLHGEDAVADTLSPYVDAAPRKEQTYFLTTQQVDEARHAVFFHRFMSEVVGLGASVHDTLAATAPQLTWGHRKVFGRLDSMARELRADPSRRKLTAAVTLYHLIIEGSLAQPGQHMIEAALERLDVLPGFRQGMRMVALDEQRHLGFGVKLLADFHAQDPAGTQAEIVGLLREVLPWTPLVAKPPNWDETYTSCLGFSLAELAEEGARSLDQKLRAIGLPVDDLPGLPMDMALPVAERARRGMLLARTNFLGPDRPVVRDPEAIADVFASIARTAEDGGAPAGTTVQWDFNDHEPWHLICGRPSTVAPGRIADPDVTLRCGLDDWADLVAGRTDPRRALLRRRLRVRARPRMLLRLPALFG